MATKTSNYEFNKPEQNDFYDVDVQNENWDKVDEELSEFDDSGVTEDIKSFPDFLSKFVTGNKVAITLRNLKAGLQFVLHAGQIVNNCVTDNAGLPLSAAQGKALMDKYTQLYSDMRRKFSFGGEMIGGYANWYKSDGRFVTMNFDTPDGANQLILEKDTAMVSILRNNKWAEQYRFATMSNLNARFMNMSDFTIEKIKSIYDANIPIVGYINYTSAISPDGNTGFVLAAAHCAIFISLTGSIYGLTSGNNWEKKN